jgi:hypothetical protein
LHPTGLWVRPVPLDRADDGTRTRSSWLGGPAPFHLGLIRIALRGHPPTRTGDLPGFNRTLYATELGDHVRGRRPDADPSALPVPGVPPLSRDARTRTLSILVPNQARLPLHHIPWPRFDLLRKLPGTSLEKPLVGKAGFEPASSSPRTKRAIQAALLPVVLRGAGGTRTRTRRLATPVHNQLCFSPERGCCYYNLGRGQPQIPPSVHCRRSPKDQNRSKGFRCTRRGAKEIRTPGLLHAMQTRFQLRHSPRCAGLASPGGPGCGQPARLTEQAG